MVCSVAHKVGMATEQVETADWQHSYNICAEYDESASMPDQERCNKLYHDSSAKQESHSLNWKWEEGNYGIQA